MSTPIPPFYEYQVGGSLKGDASSYVERQADTDLYQALLRGELCYVFSSRQMGKSSLRLRTKRRLEQSGLRCASIDMNRIGSKTITPEQWYMGLLVDLVRGLALDEIVNPIDWWQQHQLLSLPQRFSQFLEQIVLVHIHEPLFIFVDEIDSILSLDFSVDDLFALIRYGYNQRAENPLYYRLNWALFGVTTPSDLIRDRLRTPLNLGRSITLQGFKLSEAQPLAAGLMGKVSNPQAVLKEILNWTGGQPFLTQKLCHLIAASRTDEPEVLPEQLRQQLETETHPDSSCPLDYHLPIVNQHLMQFYYQLPVLAIEKFVRSRILDDWEAQDDPEHLKTIRNRLLRDDQRISRLLELYLAVWQDGIDCDDSPEQVELLLTGLVVRQQGRLQLFNRIYREVFSPAWVEQQLSRLRPYATALQAWLASDRHDDSCLLRGPDLQAAQAWAISQQLSAYDYQFLLASQAAEARQSSQTEQDGDRSRPQPQPIDASPPRCHDLRQAQQKRELIAHMSHELRTPLNAILGFSQILLRDSALTPSQQEQIRIINCSAEQLLSLINRLLELLKQDTIDPFHIALERSSVPPVCPPDTLLPDMLSLMPSDWLHQLHQAALWTDEPQILTLLEQVPASHQIAATTLAELVHNFRCDRILELIQLLLPAEEESLS
jgi:signal transduction histidine kinase